MIGTIWLGHRTLRGAVPRPVRALRTPGDGGPHPRWRHRQRRARLDPAARRVLPPASEFTKITIILGMAMLLAARVDAGDQVHPDHRTVAKALGLAALPMAVVMGGCRTSVP